MIRLIVRFFLQKYLQIYNHLQYPGAVRFSMVDVILNESKYVSTKVQKIM